MTHNERVLRLLSDGKPHSHHELYQLRVMAHSRVADLRRQGHVIAVWREKGDYMYRLLDQGHEDNGARDSVSPPARPVAVPLIEETDGQLAFTTPNNSYEKEAA